MVEFNIGDRGHLDRYNAVGETELCTVIGYVTTDPELIYRLKLDNQPECITSGICIVESVDYCPAPLSDRVAPRIRRYIS